MKKGIIFALSFIFIASLTFCGGGKNIRGDKSGTDTYNQDNRGKKSNRGRAKGVATVFDNDRALARDRALDDARNRLVEKILGATVSGQSLMKNYELVSIFVQSKSRGLVKNEQIIEENSDGNMYMVTIEGTVESAAVEDAVEDALNRYGKPKFMVLIRETFEGKMNMPGFTESEMAIQDIMGDSGFEFVDAQMTKELMKRQRRRMQKAMNGRISADVQNLLLNDVGAEVIIIGTAQTKDQSGAVRRYSRNMKSKSAIVRLKAIDVYTGRVLAATSKNAPGMHIESDTASKKAIENVFKKILGRTDRDTGKFKMGRFMDKIIMKFVKAATNRQITVFITGLDYNGLKKFRNEVEHRIRGVKQVISRGRSGRAAKLEVYFAGKTNDFIDELKAKEKSLGFSFKIPENYPNKVILRAKLSQ